MRLFELGTLAPPDPPPPGAARTAAAADLEVAMRWFDAFADELGLPDRMQEPYVRQTIEAGRLWLWDDGEPVALALRTAAAEGVARVTCVYTPPERRGRRYGGAITAASCADALARDAERVVLFTDADNPAPNAVYERIGFRPRRRPPGGAVPVRSSPANAAGGRSGAAWTTAPAGARGSASTTRRAPGWRRPPMIVSARPASRRRPSCPPVD